jgi:hypothetical protein
MVTSAEQELLARANASGAVSVYCMAALVAEEATRNGCRSFAKSIENALEVFLTGLPRDQQRQALRLSFEMAIAGTEPAPPRLRLVYSRD